MNSLGIPPCFESARTDMAVGSYFLTGPVGSGKSHLAAALCHAAMERADERAPRQNGLVRFRTMRRLFDNLNPRREVNDWSRDVLYGCGLLVIDDLGKEKVTEWRLDELFALIDHRWSHSRFCTTVITSNYRLSQLAQRMGDEVMGEAIVSRINGMCKTIAVDGADRRLS